MKKEYNGECIHGTPPCRMCEKCFLGFWQDYKKLAGHHQVTVDEVEKQLMKFFEQSKKEETI